MICGEDRKSQKERGRFEERRGKHGDVKCFRRRSDGAREKSLPKRGP